MVRIIVITIATIIALTISIIWLYVTILFIISLIIKRNDIADIAWGPGIACVALLGLYFHTQSHIFITIVTTTVCIWALRVGIRNAKKSEDPRYAQWRTAWGKWFYIRSYLQVYLLQGFLKNNQHIT